MNPEFWKGKRVFLTGHTGFKGSWLSLWLQSMGAIIKGFSLEPPTNPSLFIVANISEGMESQIGDIRDYETLFDSIESFQPDIVLHMAAQPLVRLSYEIPVDTYKCYENKEWVWAYRENEPMGGYDPYSNSKGCAELVTASFRQSFFNPKHYDQHGVGLATVRAGNVIGGGDWALDRLIPDILLAFQNEKPVEIRSPHAIRPWQHVLEPLSGYLNVAEKLYLHGADYSEPWNFGPDEKDAQAVQHLVEELANNWGKGAQWFLSEGEHPHEAHYLKLDCSKAKMRLNWQPVWNLDTALKKIVGWHQAWLRKDDMREYTLAEIKEYMNEIMRLN